MELMVMNTEEKSHSPVHKLVEISRADPIHMSTHAEADELETGLIVVPDTRIPEAMIMSSPDNAINKKPHKPGASTGPTWGHLLGQIIIGVVEILIPLAFIVGVIYWRAPWLFWAVVRFLRGEPILNF
jgi:hypothetical protein